MGIQGLTKLIADNAPDAIREDNIQNYFGRLIAIDASMSLYQFMIAVRPDELGQYTLTNDVGETTSHLQGMFYRTIRMLSSGIKPVFVFDGKPPELKSAELAKRKQKKQEAEVEKEKAEEAGDTEMIRKLNKRTTRVTPEMNEEAKKLLRLMGVPVIEAPCEAEAQCAILCKSGKVFASGSEDMDTLTCGTPVLVRHLTYSEARKTPIMEIHLDKVLKGLALTMEQFIDLCILLGCDYSDKIKGVGPKRAYEYIKKYGNIENVLKHVDKTKYVVPDPFPFEEIREYFRNPETKPVDECDLSFVEPDEDGLVQFLCTEKGFNEERVRSGVAKIKVSKQTAVQSRITSFFTPVKPTTTTTTTTTTTASKKKVVLKSPKGKSPAASTTKSPSKKRKQETSPGGEKMIKKQKK